MKISEEGCYQLFNNKLSINLPADFYQPDSETIQRVFPYEARPEVISGTDHMLRFCTFSLLQDQKLGSPQVKAAIQVIKEEVTNLYPSCLLAEPKTIRLKDGTCGWFEYQTFKNSGSLHNYMYVFPVEGSMLLGTMGCVIGDTEGEDTLLMIMKSLEICEKKLARRERENESGRVR